MRFSLFPALYALSSQLIEDYGKNYRTLKRERVLHQFIGSNTEDPDLGIYNSTDTGNEQRTQARKKRQGGFFKSLLECDPHRIESEKQFEKAECVPYVFEETLMRNQINTEPTRTAEEETMEESFQKRASKSSLLSMDKTQACLGESIADTIKAKFVFLSHGYQGNHYDCLKIKHYFGLYRPDITFINCKSNEADTTCDINLLGLRFAEEVMKALEPFHAKQQIESVSFIGHSLGSCRINRWTHHPSSTTETLQVSKAVQNVCHLLHASPRCLGEREHTGRHWVQSHDCLDEVCIAEAARNARCDGPQTDGSVQTKSR